MFHVKQLLFLLLLIPTISFSQHMGSTTIMVKEPPTLPAKDKNLDAYIDQFPGSRTLNSIQRDWFYWTNYSRSNPKRFWDSVVAPLVKTYPNLQNSYSNSLKEDLYKTNPLPLLRPNAKLAKAAQQHATELADKKAAPSHTSPSGVTFNDRMKSIAINTCAGENIAFGPGNVPLMLALLYIDEGVSNHGHRKSLLTPDFTEMGIGVGNYPQNVYMIVQDFACKQQ
jgi:hypothetical protein